MRWNEVIFETLYEVPSRNGLNRPSRARGNGYKMINMGELFSHDRIGEVDMELVQMNEKELLAMLVESGDLLFARQSLVLSGAGKCSIVLSAEDPTTFESHIIRVRLKKDIADPYFYYYYFKSPLCRIKSIVIQGVQAGIRGNDLKRLEVHAPPISEQRRIAGILTAYDNLIENNRRRITLLEKSVRTIYKEWFEDLRFPGAEHAKNINGLPKGWNNAFLPEVVAINPSTKIEKEKDVCYVPMAALSESGMTAEISKFERRSVHTSVKFKKDDVLLARITPCLENGKTGIAYFLEENEVACGSTEFIVLRGIKFSQYFTYCLARSYRFRANAIKSMVGSSGRQRVQVSCFEEYNVLLPPKHLLDMFDEMASVTFNQIRVLISENHKLSTAGNLLLPKLMSGTIAA